MKKVLFAAAFGTALIMTSCGKSPCDCIQLGKDRAAELEKATGMLDKGIIEAKYASDMEECTKMMEGKSDKDIEEAKANC